MATNRIRGYYDLPQSERGETQGGLSFLLEQIEACGRSNTSENVGSQLAEIKHQISELMEHCLWSSGSADQELLTIIAPIAQTGQLRVEDLPALHRRLAKIEMNIDPVDAVAQGVTQNLPYDIDNAVTIDALTYVDTLLVQCDYFLDLADQFLQQPNEFKKRFLQTSMLELLGNLPADHAWDDIRKKLAQYSVQKEPLDLDDIEALKGQVQEMRPETR